MILKCSGTEEIPHEQVEWLAIQREEIFCWYCSVEGYELSNGKKASLSHAFTAGRLAPKVS